MRAFHYASIDDLRRHVRDWLLAYNYAKQLKALRFKTLNRTGFSGGHLV